MIEVRRGDRRYVLRGRLDLTKGYRFRGLVAVGAQGEGADIWLAGDRGTFARRPRYYQTLTRSLTPDIASSARYWLDDHPPTLPLSNDPFDEGGEVFAHLALVALKHASFGSVYDFGRRAQRRPGGSDLRGPLSKAGPTPLDVTVADDGRLSSLRLSVAPATVVLHLVPTVDPTPVDIVRGPFAQE